ncbi:alpha/beta hydrolase [Tissierella pigra]|uniref:alpha/beta fold hydrolase n=1 Tax=Tissierella pigra TaxID=2607614 RepID=UPI001C113D87|nr:alpha/beta hydrolase [Tissierella pigra]MBU5427182.1 alpha/beta hydrolase [Tissierella pigra]
MINIIKLANINGRKVEYLFKGKGENIVVIMPGMGGCIYDWLEIVDEIEKYVQVIIIHRPGVGNSELHTDGSNTSIASEDLFSLLNLLNIKERIILVGHSYGGLCVQHFARIYPEKVKSVLLVESASIYRQDKFEKLNTSISDVFSSDEVYMKLWKKYSKYTKDKLVEELKPSLYQKESNLSSEIQKELLNIYVNPNIYINQLSEIVDLRNNVINMKEMQSFPNCPLIILIEDPYYSINEMVEEGVPRIEAEKIEALAQTLSHKLKYLSDDSKIVIVNNSNHCIHETRPDIVIDAIKDLLNS